VSQKVPTFELSVTLSNLGIVRELKSEVKRKKEKYSKKHICEVRRN